MKRLIALIIVLMLCSIAIAEDIDWSRYPDDELQATIDELTDMLNGAKAEMESRGQSEEPSQEVRVPIGVWNIGEDIPAGHYTITVAPDGPSTWGSIKVGTALDETGKDIENLESDYYYYEQVRLKGADGAVKLEDIDYDFKDGGIVIIDHTDMLFKPYVKPKLGF